MSSLQVIMGTGPVGSSTAQFLLKKGLRVRMLSKSGRRPATFLDELTAEELARLEIQAVDALDREALVNATRGASHLYHCANVLYQDWERFLPPLHANMLEAARVNGTVIAIAQNLYMYARGVPVINESTPQEAPSRKGRLQKMLHERLVETAARNGMSWAVVRASDYYGPGGMMQSVFGTDRFLDPLFAGKRPAMLGNPDIPHSYTYVEDYGRALATAALDPAAHGTAWIVPNDRTLTTREVARMFFTAAGRDGEVGHIPRALLSVAGLFNPLLHEVVEVLYQKEEPYVVDGSMFQSRFGFQPTSLEEGIRRTLAWYRETRGIEEAAAA